MAIAASAIWRIRPGGNILNGAVYDGTTYSGGSDFSQQDAAQLSLTDVACTGTTTVTSATAGFTAAMVGNGINLTSGTGVTVGHYLIASFTNSTTVVLDRIPGTFTGGVGRVGGAWGSSTSNPFALGDNSRAVGNKPVAGNTIYIRGAGTDTPATADYTFSTSYVSAVAGDATSGMISWIGESGRPRIQGIGLLFHAMSHNRLSNLYLTTSSNSTSRIISDVVSSLIDNVHFNTNSQATFYALGVNGGATVVNCEIWSGSTTPTTSTSSQGIQVTGGTNQILGCKIRHMRTEGILVSSQSYGHVIRGNQIFGCVGDSISLGVSNSQFPGEVVGNTIHGGSGHAINIANIATLAAMPVIVGNIISGHTVAAKIGLNIAAGTAAQVAAIRRFFDYNFFFNNTTHRSTNLAAGGADVTLSADPYTNAAAFDFTLNATAGGGAAVRAKGFPAVFGTYPATGLTRANYPDGGAAQHADPAGGGGGGISFFGGM